MSESKKPLSRVEIADAIAELPKWEQMWLIGYLCGMNNLKVDRYEGRYKTLEKLRDEWGRMDEIHRKERLIL
jgi:hypothetical protein